MDDAELIAQLEEENEMLLAELAMTRKALVIEEGKCYVLETQSPITPEQVEHMHSAWQEYTKARCMIISGVRVVRVRE